MTYLTHSRFRMHGQKDRISQGLIYRRTEVHNRHTHTLAKNPRSNLVSAINRPCDKNSELNGRVASTLTTIQSQYRSTACPLSSLSLPLLPSSPPQPTSLISPLSSPRLFLRLLSQTHSPLKMDAHAMRPLLCCCWLALHFMIYYLY